MEATPTDEGNRFTKGGGDRRQKLFIRTKGHRPTPSPNGD
jgi:hypothetical protein